MSTEKQITLARAMGWRRVTEDTTHRDYELFFPPNNWKRSGPSTYHILGLPNPLTSDTDAMALVTWLKTINWSTTIRIWSNRKHRVTMFHQPLGYRDWKGDNYREGLVELAYPIAEEYLREKEGE